jgi:hypothetical protein
MTTMKRRSATAVVTSMLILSGTAHAGIQEDIDRIVADKKSGCKSIPFSGLDSTCENKQSNVNEYCKEEKFTCYSLGTAGDLANIERIKGKLSSLGERKRDLVSKRDAAKDDAERSALGNEIAKVDDETAELGRRVDDMQRRVAQTKSQAEPRIGVGQRCREARIDVDEVFGNAQGKLRALDANIVESANAQSLLAHWKSEEEGHVRQIKSVQEAVINCQEVVEGKR